MIFGLNRDDTNIKYICDQYNFFNNNKIYWYFSGKIFNDYYNYSPQDVNITRMIWTADTVKNTSGKCLTGDPQFTQDTASGWGQRKLG